MAQLVLSTIVLGAGSSITCRRCRRAIVFDDDQAHGLMVWDHGGFVTMSEPGRGPVHRCGSGARWACSCGWIDLDGRLEELWRSRRRRPRCPACYQTLAVATAM